MQQVGSRKGIDALDYEVDTVAKDEWHSILNRFRDASVYQTWSYGSVRWGSENLSHLIVKRESCIVSAVQVRIVRVPLIGDAIAYIYRGPMWKSDEVEESIENLQEIIRAIIVEYVEKRGLFVRIVPNATDKYGDSVAELFKLTGFKPSLSRNSHKTIYVELDSSLDELHQGLSKKWRENLRRAGRSGLDMEEGKAGSLYDEFIALYRQMHARKKFVQFVDIHEYKSIQYDLPDDLKMNVLLCRHEGEPVSALVYTAIGDTGIPIFSATGNRWMKLRGSYLLRWHMLENLKKNGCRFLDQGGIDKKNNPGGYHFKSGMGGEVVEFIGEFEKCNSILKLLLVYLYECQMNMYRKMKLWINRLFKR